MLLSNAILMFVESKSNSETRRAYTEDLTCFIARVGDRDLDDLTFRDLLLYRKYLEETVSPRTGRPLATATIVKRLKMVKTFIRWCTRKGWLRENVAEELRLDHLPITVHKKAIPPGDLKAMLDAIRDQIANGGKQISRQPERDLLILAILASMAVRRSDLARLRLGDVSLTKRELLLRRKGGRHQTIPLPQVVDPIYRTWLSVRPKTARHDFVLCSMGSQGHGPMTPVAISQAFRRISKRVTHVSRGPHSARHGWAFQALKAGVPVPVAQRIMGHTTSKLLLETYGAADLEDERAVLDDLPFLAADVDLVDNQPQDDAENIIVVDMGSWELY